MPQPTNSELFSLPTDRVSRLEFLPNPAVTFEEHFNTNELLSLQRFSFLMENLFGPIRIGGFEVSLDGGVVVVHAGKFIHKYFVIEEENDLNVESFEDVDTKVILEITEEKYTFESNRDEVKEEYEGRDLSGPNQYRYSLNYYTTTNSVPSDTTNKFYVHLADIDSDGTITQQTIHRDEIIRVINSSENVLTDDNFRQSNPNLLRPLSDIIHYFLKHSYKDASISLNSGVIHFIGEVQIRDVVTGVNLEIEEPTLEEDHWVYVSLESYRQPEEEITIHIEPFSGTHPASGTGVFSDDDNLAVGIYRHSSDTVELYEENEVEFRFTTLFNDYNLESKLTNIGFPLKSELESELDTLLYDRVVETIAHDTNSHKYRYKKFADGRKEQRGYFQLDTNGLGIENSNSGSSTGFHSDELAVPLNANFEGTDSVGLYTTANISLRSGIEYGIFVGGVKVKDDGAGGRELSFVLMSDASESNIDTLANDLDLHYHVIWDPLLDA